MSQLPSRFDAKTILGSNRCAVLSDVTSNANNSRNRHLLKNRLILFTGQFSFFGFNTFRVFSKSCAMTCKIEYSFIQRKIHLLARSKTNRGGR